MALLQLFVLVDGQEVDRADALEGGAELAQAGLERGVLGGLALLENDEDPLECGIDIIARPPGKKPQTISLLSGGERTMTAVALLFAIFLIKPAPFCLLDELDAALDDSNIGRFVDALKDFLVHSQFLIITHNQHTIAGSDIVYGVTMPEKGVSRTLSMRFDRRA
ncbi:MAG TPA: AAA family ATPase [Candidatus Spyradenecus faecavium]|uniref:AAA family ATPase n=1 Tax=Candidatus Spyradenecus faecavium TaxID=2840947 RepID=A0A9D1NMH6_9BACT|nr:AAA family ATPase [Candidatus Spyradenecus faecavium]